MALDSFVGDGLSPSPYKEACAEIARLRAECEALRADAERYRWLKANARRIDVAGLSMTDTGMRQLNARIDAALVGSDRGRAGVDALEHAARQGRMEMSDDNDRYQIVRAGFWWRIKIGDGSMTYGRFYTHDEAEKMVALLLREFRNGKFLGNAAIDAARKGSV